MVTACPIVGTFRQSTFYSARALEAAGIATVIMGCAKDIVEHVGVPRLVFNNFPLGNSAGLPQDPDSQLAIAGQALDLLVTAIEPRTTEQSPYNWSGKENWQDDYSNAKILDSREVAKRRNEFDKAKAEAKSAR